MREADVARASVDVAVDQASAFAVFTGEIGDWYVIDEHSVPDHTKTKSLRIEPWVGGHFIDVYDLDTQQGLVVGTVTVWDPPRRLAFVDGRDLTVDVQFEPIESGCRVTIEERGLAGLAADTAEHVREHGWHRYLPEWFTTHVNQGASCR